MARAALPAESSSSAFKVLGPIPKDIKNYGYYSPPENYYDADRFKSIHGCLKARSFAYDQLKLWQRDMQRRLGRDFRAAEKESAAAKVATKDAKRKKQIGEWEGQLSVNVRQMANQIDEEYQSAVKRVHFQVTCP